MTIAVSPWTGQRAIETTYNAAPLRNGGVAFSEMLRGMDGVQNQAMAAARFDSLGVFGRAAAIDAPKLQPPVTDGPLPTRPADWNVDGGKKMDAAQALTAAQSAPTVAAPAETANLPTIPVNLFVFQEREATGPPVVFVAASKGRGSEAASVTSDIVTTAGTVQLQSDPQRSRFMMPRVAIHNDGAKAYIVVRSGILDEDSHMRLRRRIAATLREYGLDVAEFVADGVVVGQTFESKTGGAHGYFKR